MHRDNNEDPVKSYEAWLAWFDELPQADKLGIQAEHALVKHRLARAKGAMEAQEWLRSHRMARHQA